MPANPYLEELRGWDWTHPTECYPDEEGQGERRDYLGSCITLAPSGKYYLPFACGNVEPCPRCQGEGSIPNRAANEELEKLCRARRHSLTEYLFAHYGYAGEGNWPPLLSREARRLDCLAEKYRARRTCPKCAGVGSFEAYQDELFWEALDTVAEENGGYITGDSGDVFFAVSCEGCPSCLAGEGEVENG